MKEEEDIAVPTVAECETAEEAFVELFTAWTTTTHKQEEKTILSIPAYTSSKAVVLSSAASASQSLIFLDSASWTFCLK